jgi:hypothetical protein
MKPGEFSMAQYLFLTYLTNEKPSTQQFINIKHNNYSNICQLDMLNQLILVAMWSKA